MSLWWTTRGPHPVRVVIQGEEVKRVDSYKVPNQQKQSPNQQIMAKKVYFPGCYDITEKLTFDLLSTKCLHFIILSY